MWYLNIRGAFSKDTIRNGVNILDTALYYANIAKYIITAGTCATFGGLFRENKDDIEGFIFKKICQ